MKSTFQIIFLFVLIVNLSQSLFISLNPKEKYCLGYFLNKDEGL
jgi:hypothetical protein